MGGVQVEDGEMGEMEKDWPNFLQPFLENIDRRSLFLVRNESFDFN